MPRGPLPHLLRQGHLWRAAGRGGARSPNHRSQQSPHAFQTNTAMFKESTGRCLAWREGRLWAPLWGKPGPTIPGTSSSLTHRISVPALGPAKALPQEASLGHGAALEEAVGPLPELGLHGKVEPRSTHRGNSRVQLLTDVSWKAAGYIGTVPALSLSPLSCPPTPQLLFSPRKNHNQREAGRHNQVNQKEPT